MTADLYPYTHLFEPVQVNGIKLKNRLVMGPMGNISMAEETGRPNAKMIAYFIERAQGGVGLITTGLVPVSHGIDPSVTELGKLSYFPRIDRSRTVYAGWRDLAEGVHAYGTHIFIQLTPGLGRVGSPECLINKYRLPVSASWNPNFYMPIVPCRPLFDRECRRIIRNAGQAAADAKAALIDGVYLHGHEGYLLDQLTNPAFNRRTLGHFTNWQTFGIELVQEIRRRVGLRYPIMYRIDLSTALNATYGDRMETVTSLKKFRNERLPDMTLAYMENLVKAGVDMFDVDLGCYDNWWLPHPPTSMAPGCYLQVAQVVKAYFTERGVKSNAGLEVPVVAVGKLGYPDLAEKALREGACDLIMLARPLLADPQWPNKAYAGRVAEICPCIGDQEGCINEFVEGGHPQCAVNPRTGFEDVIPRDLAPLGRKKNVAVVGAGASGIVCACVAAARGHSVVLYEKNRQIGGWLVPGSVPRIKYDVGNYLNYLEHRLAMAQAEHGLQLRLHTHATVDLLTDEGYDAVVCAIGAEPVKPPIPGIDAEHVVQAVDVLLHPEWAEKAARVTVIGGGAVGCETAYWLAYELGKHVSVIEMLPSFMKGVCTANRGHIIHYLEDKGVELLNGTQLKSISKEYITVVRNVSPTLPDPYLTWTPLLPENIENPLVKPIKQELKEMNIPCDLVVLAMGLKSVDALYFACQEQRVVPEIYYMGDVFSPGRIFEATKAGYRVGNLM
ncbi:MAG TPA: FAD-dependent oxidoreductase [Deltaproteobacteria bacterium]|nr:FAD-dependent oxidoreductase [Deltaproteobacteria bacterium]